MRHQLLCGLVASGRGASHEVGFHGAKQSTVPAGQFQTHDLVFSGDRPNS